MVLNPTLKGSKLLTPKETPMFFFVFFSYILKLNRDFFGCRLIYVASSTSEKKQIQCTRLK